MTRQATPPIDPADAVTDPGHPADFDGPRPPTPKPPSRFRKWFFRVVLSGLLLAIAAGATFAGLVAHYSHNLPSFESLKDYEPPQTTRIYGSDGTVAGEIFSERRTVVPFEQIPPVMIQAITSAEDANFFEHSGVDFMHIAKCLVRDMIPGGRKCGGSTLTQQTVKTMLLTNERTLSRKIKEAILARRLEKHLSKEQILSIYLNQINFGHGRYGIEEASRLYFGHSVKDLSLGEAAVLASIPKWPSEINPLTNPARTKERQTYVLRRMVENHFITQAVAEREIARPIAVPAPQQPAFGASYIEEVRRAVTAKLGDDVFTRGGLRIDVMMNPTLQQAAEASMKQGLKELDKRQGWRGPLGNIDEDAWAKLKEGGLGRLKRMAHAKENLGDDPVLDLRNVDVDSLQDDETESAALRAAVWRKRVPGLELVARVFSVSKTQAEVDLGTSHEVLSLASVSWARKFNPTSGTASPKAMTDVVNEGDLVRVRLGKAIACAKAPCPHLSEITLEQEPLVQGAFVAIDPKTRGISALVGGYDFNAGTNAFDRATQAKRQPGSAFKPFVYATALEVGQERAELLRTTPREQIKSSCLVFEPRIPVNDAPEVIYDHWTGKPWTPHNFEKDIFEGAISLRHALAVSKNTVAVKLIEQIGCLPTDTLSFADSQNAGLTRVKDMARRAGLDSPIPNSITAALGSGEVTPLELVNAYTTFASNGRYAAPILISRVTRASSGEVLVENRMSYEQPVPVAPDMPPPPPTRGIRPDVAYVTAQLMRAVVDDPDGTAHGLSRLGRPISGKTGTANDHRDAWFVGFTPEIVSGAWVGFDDHAALGPRETGAHAAGPIWLNFMTVAEDKLPRGEVEVPAGVVAVDIDPRTGLLADPHSPYLEHEVYLAGTEPKEISTPTQVKTEDYWRDGP